MHIYTYVCMYVFFKCSENDLGDPAQFLAPLIWPAVLNNRNRTGNGRKSVLLSSHYTHGGDRIDTAWVDQIA